MRPRSIAILWVLLLFLVFPVKAQAVDVYATVDATQVAAGESINLTVTVKGGQGSVDTAPIRDFSVVSSGTGSSIQIINGSVSRQTQYHFQLVPSGKGHLLIPALAVTVDGKTYHTRAIRVTVSDAPSLPANGQADVFVKAQTSLANPYQGQQLIYTFRLFSAVQIANARLQKPDFAGFTAKEIEEKDTGQRLINGRAYNVTTLSYLLMPLKAGALTIAPAALSCDVAMAQTGRQNPFGGFFNDPFFGQARMQHRVFRTEPITLDVRDLPPYSAKGAFSGLVGRFEISAALDTSRLKVGDTATLTVTISGTGNIMDAALPETDIPDAFKVYTDKAQEKISLDAASGYSGKKMFHQALVPLRAGTYQLAAIALNYFDPSSAAYQTVSTAPITVTALPGEKTQNAPAVSPPPAGQKPSKQDVTLTGRDILTVKEDSDALKDHQPMSLAVFFMLLAAGPLGYGLLYLIVSRKNRADNPVRIKSAKSAAALKQALRPGLSEAEFLSCLYSALVAAVLARGGAHRASLTAVEAQVLLETAGYPQPLIQQCRQVLEQIESVRFGAAAFDDATRQSLLSQTRELIRRLS
jgi:hypothetical protein